MPSARRAIEILLVLGWTALGVSYVVRASSPERAWALDDAILYTHDDALRGCWVRCAAEHPRLLFTTNPRILLTATAGPFSYAMERWFRLPPRVSIRLFDFALATLSLFFLWALGGSIGMRWGARLVVLLWVGTTFHYQIMTVACFQDVAAAAVLYPGLLLYHRKKELPAGLLLGLTFLGRFESGPALGILWLVSLFQGRRRLAAAMAVPPLVYWGASLLVVGTIPETWYASGLYLYTLPWPASWAERILPPFRFLAGCYGTVFLLVSLAAVVGLWRSLWWVGIFPVSTLATLLGCYLLAHDGGCFSCRYLISVFPLLVLLAVRLLERFWERGGLGARGIVAGLLLAQGVSNLRGIHDGIPDKTTAHLFRMGYPGVSPEEVTELLDWLEWYVREHQVRIIWQTFDFYDVTMSCRCSLYFDRTLLWSAPGSAIPPGWSQPFPYWDFRAMRPVFGKVPDEEGVLLTRWTDTGFARLYGWNQVVYRSPSGIVVYRIPPGSKGEGGAETGKGPGR